MNTGELSAPFSTKKPAVIGVQFMGDLFHESLSNEQIAAVFGVMAATPQHQYVVLTKRLDRAVDWFGWMSAWAKASDGDDVEARISIAQMDNWIGRRHHVDYPAWPLPNVIIGTSVEDFRYHPRIDDLRRIPATKRIVSFEPMLGPITANLCGIDLVICGAETGSGKRPFKDEWALDLRDQCKAAGTPYFFKKDGAGKPTLCGVEYHEWIREI